jgi:ABC-type phosphate transport system substrate-binding protein
MKRSALLGLLAAALLAAASPRLQADDSVIVIGHAALRALDADTVKRIYTGRVIELGGQDLRPVNLVPGHPLRQRFLASVLGQSEEDYLAYWTVRRYIGKGTPPRELDGTGMVIEYVRRTPGALGYIDAAQWAPGLNVLLRR